MGRACLTYAAVSVGLRQKPFDLRAPRRLPHPRPASRDASRAFMRSSVRSLTVTFIILYDPRLRKGLNKLNPDVCFGSVSNSMILRFHFDSAAGSGYVQPCEAAYLASMDAVRGGKAIAPEVTVLVMYVSLSFVPSFLLSFVYFRMSLRTLTLD